MTTCIIKFRWLLVSLFLLFFLFQPSYATVNSLANVHFCLPNAEGQPPKDCTGLVLTKKNVSVFSDFYQGVPALNSNWTGSSRLVPLPSASTSQTPLNMVSHTTASALDYTVYNPVVYQWRDISKLVYFGGSVNEGQVLLPTPGWIKASHQNGASVFGTIFFSPTAYGGGAEESQLDYMLTPDSSGHYPVADLLISVAKQYGIDGYFINQETPYPNGKTDKDLSGFVQYIQQASKNAGYPVQVEWYFVLNSDSDNAFVADSLFLDYGEWNNTTVDHQIANGYPAAQVEYGINGANSSAVSDIPNAASAAMFAYSNVLAPDDDRKTSPDQQYLNAINFWKGVPEALKQSNSLNYPSTHIFATTFNAGLGDDYYMQGKAQNYGFWSAIGLQDLLPIDLTGSIISLNFKDAYNGGSSLQALSKTANQMVILYAHLHIVPTDDAILAVKYKPVVGDKPFQICAHYLDGSDEGTRCVVLATTGKLTNDTWRTASINLPSLSASGYYDSITLSTPKTNQGEIMIGQLYLGSFEAYGKEPVAVQSLQLNKAVPDKDSTMHYIVTWKNVSSNKYYNVYVNDQFYGVTYQNIEDVMVTNTQKAEVCVIPQNYGGITGESNCITVSS